MKTNVRVQMALAAACAVTAGGLMYLNVAPAGANAGPLNTAWQAVRNVEAIENARDQDGNYLSQTEGVEWFTEALSRHMSDSYIGVTGLGHITDAFGYQPTQHGVAEFAASGIAFRDLGIAADLAAGGDGTNDWIHTPVTGSVSGNTAYFILNFAHYGSFVDDEGNRLPTEIPNWMIGLPGEGSVPITGRCICVCDRVDGRWTLKSFYYVQTPIDLLHDV